MLNLDTKQFYLVVGGVALTASTLGFVAGYKLQAKKLEAKYAEISEQEIKEAKLFYATLKKKEEYADPMEMLAAVADKILVEEGYSPDEAVETITVNGQEVRLTDSLVRVPKAEATEQVAKIVRNVFTTPDDVWDEATEYANRGLDPFVISQDEYMRAVDGVDQTPVEHEQASLTYYEGDGVLADERDEVIPNDMIGDDNLMLFGHGSNDANIVYVRNMAVDTDFEVIHDHNKFSVKVLGFEDPDNDTLTHSHQRRARRYRSADE